MLTDEDLRRELPRLSTSTLTRSPGRPSSRPPCWDGQPDTGAGARWYGRGR